MELKDAIVTRRTVRKFTDYRVTDNEVEELLEAVRWSPTWANTQSWEFIVIRDSDRIKAVTDTYSPSNPGRRCSENASLLIAICADTTKAGHKKGVLSTEFNEWFMFDLGIATQNLSLKAHDMGLGSVIIGSLDHEKCAQILEVSNPYKLAAILVVGKPETIKTEQPERRTVTDIMHREFFGNK